MYTPHEQKENLNLLQWLLELLQCQKHPPGRIFTVKWVVMKIGLLISPVQKLKNVISLTKNVTHFLTIILPSKHEQLKFPFYRNIFFLPGFHIPSIFLQKNGNFQCSFLTVFLMLQKWHRNGQQLKKNEHKWVRSWKSAIRGVFWWCCF